MTYFNKLLLHGCYRAANRNRFLLLWGITLYTIVKQHLLPFLLCRENHRWRCSRRPAALFSALHEDWMSAGSYLRRLTDVLGFSGFRKGPWSCFPSPALPASLNRHITGLLWLSLCFRTPPEHNTLRRLELCSLDPPEPDRPLGFSSTQRSGKLLTWPTFIRHVKITAVQV